MNNQITESHIQLVNKKTMFNLLGNQGRETEAMSIPFYLLDYQRVQK